MTIGRATGTCETLHSNGGDRIQDGEPEWRVPVKWLAEWRDDADAYPYKSRNFTFWNVTGPKYRDLRDGVKRQGQRQLTLDCRKDFEQELRVPTTRTTFHDQASLAGMLLEQ